MWRIDVEVVFSLTRIRNQDPRDPILGLAQQCKSPSSSAV